jgi:membrane-bound metal-dependent hydrolase YbcI (DUF457 family)
VIFGHLTVTAAVLREARRLRPSLPIASGALLLGAYLPDILDKPIGLITGLAGRGYGHSLVVQAAVFALALFAFPRHRARVATVALGAAIHLLEDWVEPRVLWAPLLGPVPTLPLRGFLETLRRYYTSGSVQVRLEVVATVYWIAVGAVALRSHSRRAASRREAAHCRGSRALPLRRPGHGPGGE